MKRLIGKQIKFKSRYVTCVGIVVAADRNHGITIVKEEDPEENLICLHGPTAPLGEHHAPYYKEYFDHVVKCIEDGAVLYTNDLINIRMANDQGRGSFSRMAFCAFS